MHLSSYIVEKIIIEIFSDNSQWVQLKNKMSTNPAVVSPGNDALPTSYPDLDATSPTDSVIAGDFGQMSSADQVSILT